MAALRRAYVACVLTFACSSADPSTDGPGFVGVYALDPSSDCHDECPNEEIIGAAVAQGSVWVTRASTLENCNGQCNFVSENASLAQAVLGDDGGVTQLATTADFTDTGLVSSGVDVTSDGTTIYFAHGADPSKNQMVFQALTATGADAGSVTQGPSGYVIGVAADAHVAIFAVAAGPQLQQNQSPNFGSDQGEYQFGSGSAGGDGTGSLYRVDFDDDTVTPLAAQFDLALSAHLFAYDATNVYWIAPGQVFSAPRDTLAQATPIGTVPVANEQCCNQQNFVVPAGLSAANGAVVWSTLAGSGGCTGSGDNNQTCTFAAGGCTLYETGDVAIYSDPTIACMGLATDGTDAYFDIVEETSSQECCSDDGGLQTNYYVVTTGIGRVSLAGPATQKPVVVSFDTTRFYGPRRLMVDDDFVYGIDPAYVVRIPKGSFK